VDDDDDNGAISLLLLPPVDPTCPSPSGPFVIVRVPALPQRQHRHGRPDRRPASLPPPSSGNIPITSTSSLAPQGSRLRWELMIGTALPLL